MLGENSLMYDIHKCTMYCINLCTMYYINLCTRSSLNRISALGADGGGGLLPS